MQDGCIFCQIVAGAAPAHVVYEDARILAFLDLFPVAEGHTLIIPKAHAENVFEARSEDLAGVMAASKPLAHAIRAAFTPDGLGVYQLNGAAAGQTVFHYHMHLIPRREGAGLALHSRVQGEADALEAVAVRIREALAGTL